MSSIAMFLGFFLMLIGLVVNFMAKPIVQKLRLDLKVHCDFKDEIQPEEVAQYQFQKAILQVKLLALVIVLPGILWTIYVFR